MKKVEAVIDKIIEVLALMFIGRWRPMGPGEEDWITPL
jgi:hypothetical protein